MCAEQDFPSPLFIPLQNLRDQGFNPFEGGDSASPRVPWMVPTVPAPVQHEAGVMNLHESAWESVKAITSTFTLKRPFWDEVGGDGKRKL